MLCPIFTMTAKSLLFAQMIHTFKSFLSCCVSICICQIFNSQWRLCFSPLIPAFHWLSPGSCPNQTASLSLNTQTKSPSLFPTLTVSEEKFFTQRHSSGGTRDVPSASSTLVSANSNPTPYPAPVVKPSRPTLNVSSVNVDVNSNASIMAGFHVTRVYGEANGFLLMHGFALCFLFV